MTILTYTAIAALIMVGAFRMFSGQKAPETVRVVAAGRDIPAGCRLSFANLHYLDLPPNYYRKDMFTSYGQLVGKTTKAFIPAREPFSASTVIADERGFVTQLPKGFRAVTINLTPEGLVDGVVRPGDRVDIIATTSYKGKRFTKTIGQNVLVMLSTPKEVALSDLKGEQNNRITLAALPADAEILSQAADTSKLRLTLRSLGDVSKAVLAGADERDLLPHEALREEAPTLPVPPSPERSAVSVLPPPLPPLPQAMMQSIPPAVSEPVKWVVQMFSGNRQEMREIPVSQ